jgi:phosphate transport system ATP-binding protein
MGATGGQREDAGRGRRAGDARGARDRRAEGRAGGGPARPAGKVAVAGVAAEGLAGAGGPALAAPEGEAGAPVLAAVGLHVRYPGLHALKGVTLSVPMHGITAVIGPSGCGKSTLLRSFNRMNDRVPGVATEGRVLFRGQDVYGPGVDPVALRRRIGMVFQRPAVFPMSVFDNVAYGPRVHRLEPTRRGLRERVERSLRDAGLWAEVRDRLREPAAALSGGQQQRLAIARALAVDPEVILLDEPTSALDPIAAGHIEDTLQRLASRFTIVLVTHNLQQAARVARQTAFLLDGELVEVGPTEDLFHHPRDPRTEDYLTGRWG